MIQSVKEFLVEYPFAAGVISVGLVALVAFLFLYGIPDRTKEC